MYTHIYIYICFVWLVNSLSRYGDARYEWWADAAGQSCFDNVRKVHELRPELLGGGGRAFKYW